MSMSRWHICKPRRLKTWDIGLQIVLHIQETLEYPGEQWYVQAQNLSTYLISQSISFPALELPALNQTINWCQISCRTSGSTLLPISSTQRQTSCELKNQQFPSAAGSSWKRPSLQKARSELHPSSQRSMVPLMATRLSSVKMIPACEKVRFWCSPTYYRRPPAGGVVEARPSQKALHCVWWTPTDGSWAQPR